MKNLDFETLCRFAADQRPVKVADKSGRFKEVTIEEIQFFPLAVKFHASIYGHDTRKIDSHIETGFFAPDLTPGTICPQDENSDLNQLSAIVELGQFYGWDSHGYDLADDSQYQEAAENVTEFLQDLAPEGYKLGFDEDGNWGVYLLPNYIYHFHEERGECRAHVDDATGNTVWQADNWTPDDDEPDRGPYLGEFWPVRDGFMRHTTDTAGLLSYLQSIKILPGNATLSLAR